MEKIIAQGAEAVLIRKNNELIKRRIAKSYRHPDLDKKLRVRRTRSETKLLGKASKIVNVPKISSSNEKNSEIIMEFVDGKILSDELDNMNIDNALKICHEMGKSIALIHEKDIIHGDLTTSNMILHHDENRKDFQCAKNSERIFKQNQVYFIDFGLGFHSSKVEDKAVDLHLLKQAFESRHFGRWQEYYKETINGYKENSDNAQSIVSRLEKVEKRGRYKRKKKLTKEKNI